MKSEGSQAPLTTLVAQVCRLHHARAHSLLEALGLYRGQPPLLQALAAQEGLSHSDLAVRLHVTPATVSKMVSRMEKAGVVVTQSDPDDQRVSRVYLTDYGRQLHYQAVETGWQLEAETFAGFEEGELSLLRGFMERMRANLIHVVDEKALARPHGGKPREKSHEPAELEDVNT